jgi:serine carboxypeptidase-like clade I
MSLLVCTGGPGSSSLYGFLQENGPLMMAADGGLMDNPWSWTKIANLVALESPVGVGYSYCESQTRGKKCRNTDKDTATASRAALQHLFQKFPELAKSDFFITGESYAGVYIPTLTKEILDHAPEINLKGIAVGDPCTDNTAQADSMDSLWYDLFEDRHEPWSHMMRLLIGDYCLLTLHFLVHSGLIVFH